MFTKGRMERSFWCNEVQKKKSKKTYDKNDRRMKLQKKQSKGGNSIIIVITIIFHKFKTANYWPLIEWKIIGLRESINLKMIKFK